MDFRGFSVTACAATLALSASMSSSDEINKSETAGMGDTVHTMFAAFANQTRSVNLENQVNARQKL